MSSPDFNPFLDDEEEPEDHAPETAALPLLPMDALPTKNEGLPLVAWDSEAEVAEKFPDTNADSAISFDELASILEDSERDSEGEESGFLPEEENQSLNLEDIEDDDWSLLLDEGDEEPEDEWQDAIDAELNDTDAISSWGAPPQELDEDSFTAPLDEEDSTDEAPEDRELSLINEEEDNASEPLSEPEPKHPKIALKPKMQDLWQQIKSELRGEDAPRREQEQEEDPEEQAKERKPSSIKKIALLLASPYVFLAKKILALLQFVLKFLAKIPLVGAFALKIPLKILSLIAFLLPLILLAYILYWGGSKPLTPAKELEFPDGGRASFENFSYDEEANRAVGTVVNRGEVKAPVTPTFTVYSIQPSLNPLSFFYPKPMGECVGEMVEVPIGESVEVSAPCDRNGVPRKVTGELKW